MILAAQDVVIRRIMVEASPGQITLQDPILKNTITKKGWWTGSRSNPSSAKTNKQNQKNPKTLRYYMAKKKTNFKCLP
jgi:hypothetical protein